MGFVGIVPASRLAAAYDTGKKILMLYAEGQVLEYTAAIQFVQDKEVADGHQFTLYGTSGPIKSPRQFRPYQCTNQFPMELPAGTAAVTVVNAFHPEGVAVAIHYFGLGEANPLIAELSAPTADDVAAKANALGEQRTINVKADGTFVISQSTAVSPGGAIRVEADAAYVSLLGAAVVTKGEPQIQWTFRANRVGNTAVTVVVEGGIATYILQIPYTVVIS